MDSPQQTTVSLDGLTFSSHFDSGNMSKVSRISPGQYEIFVSADAATTGHNNYRAWFYFGISGLTRNTVIRLSVANLSFMRVFTSANYRPVWRSCPEQLEWRRIDSEAFYEQNFGIYYKYSWSFEVPASENQYFFAYAPPYPYAEIRKTVDCFQQLCPPDSVLFRETLIKSIEGREVELLTFSNRHNFSEVREASLPDLFPSNERCLVCKKPVVFITARVHPGETPASFVLDGVLQLLLSSDPRAVALRANFVFKIIPVLNPDGVYRGNFRVDQNGLNLNRCYSDPEIRAQPTIYATKKYFDYIAPKVRYYFDLHAHASKRSCFLFGNFLEIEKQVENQLLAKLIEINSGYFEYSECDFTEKSMRAKDPKDFHSKEGSGRVALFRTSGIVHCYTLECAYFIQRPLHIVPSAIVIKTGKKCSDIAINEGFGVKVFNKDFFFDVASAILFSILDYEKCSPISRVPLSEFRFVEAAKEWIKSRVLAQLRLITKKLSTGRNEIKAKSPEKFIAFPKLAPRTVQKANILAPLSQESSQVGKVKMLAYFGRNYPGKNMFL